MKTTEKSKLVLAALLLLFCAVPACSQSEQKRIYIAPDDHTDYLWSLDEEGYRRAFLEMLDYYLALADATQNNPAPYQSRWNCDGNFWVWTYEKNKTQAEFERLIGRIRDGHISMPLNALVSCYGGQPAEAVLRGMYYAGSLERRYRLRFPLAVAMENQTMPFGLGALWAGAGAKYSWKGVCNCSTRSPDPGNREQEIYWWEGMDGSRILMKWHSLLHNNNASIGGYAEARDVLDAIRLADTDTTFLSRYPFAIIGLFGKGWDDEKTLTDEFVSAAQTQSNARRQVIVSNEQDFFQDFEAKYGAGLPTVAASFGNEWELYCASLAEVSARVKRAVERLRSAEALATLVSLHDANFMPARRAAAEQAWMDFGLYWEHNWTADGRYSREVRADWQRKIAAEIEDYVNNLQVDAATALGALIKRSGDAPRFYAFNPLSWPRTDYADIPYSGPGPVYAVDLSTGEETPSQAITLDGKQYLRVLARNVPAVGYKVFELRQGEGSQFSDAASYSGNTLENAFYRVTLNGRGAITSLVDKTRGDQEFASHSSGRAINDLGAGDGTVEVENPGPVSVTLRATSSAPLRHTTRITLWRDSDRIEIRNEITQNFGDVQTWSYSFNLNNPDVRHEEVGAVLRAKLLGDGGHYSPRNARYDWLTLNHFADMSGAGRGITLSNADTYFMRLGNSTPGSLDTATPQLSVLAGGQVDGPALGIPNQGGDNYFLQRFALRTHDEYSAAEAMRFALEHQNPLTVGTVTGGHAYPEFSYSLLSISDPNVMLWAVKPAEEGIAQGIVARIYNAGDAVTNFTLEAARPVTSAVRTTHIETDLAAAATNNGTLTATIARQQFQTYRLFTGTPTANQPPAISILSPTDGALVNESEGVTIECTAGDADGTVRKVEFFSDGAKVGESAAKPYALALPLLPTGAHIITARAVDDQGRAATSSRVRLTVVKGVAGATSVSAANYRGGTLARGSIVSAFGTSLAVREQGAVSLPLPTNLGGTTVTVKDSIGRQHAAPLFYVSPTQVNYQIPDAAAMGTATVTITSGDGQASRQLVQITASAPGLFTADASGAGLAAALVLRVKADQSQVYEPVVKFDPAQGAVVTVPIDLGPASEQVFLLLFGTGIRYRAKTATAQITIDGEPAEVIYAGPQGIYVGLDQINVRLPRTLIGRGKVGLKLTVGGQEANGVRLVIK